MTLCFQTIQREKGACRKGSDVTHGDEMHQSNDRRKRKGRLKNRGAVKDDVFGDHITKEEGSLQEGVRRHTRGPDASEK